jgi:hypothetical protein
MASYSAPQRSTGRLKRPFGDLYYEVAGNGPALLFAHGLGLRGVKGNKILFRIFLPRVFLTLQKFCGFF